MQSFADVRLFNILMFADMIFEVSFATAFGTAGVAFVDSVGGASRANADVQCENVHIVSHKMAFLAG